MESLAALSTELGQLGANKLYLAAQSRGLAVSRQQVNDLVKNQGARQVLRPRPRATGKMVATRISDRWAADLIDYAARATFKTAYKYILIVQDIVSRRVWARPLLDKTPEITLQGFRDIMREAGKSKPRELDTDDGAEFKGFLTHTWRNRESSIALPIRETRMQGALWTTPSRRCSLP